MKRTTFTTVLVATLLLCAATASAQRSFYRRPLADNVFMPQVRPHPIGRPAGVVVTSIDVVVEIIEQVATTTLDIHLENPGHVRQEAELLLPVPDGAAVRGFTFQGKGAEPVAQLLPVDEARRIYDSIVAQMKDPALLEFVGYKLVRSSVFPVEARGTQQVRLTYETLLIADGDRVDYVLPRSESLSNTLPWNIKVSVKAKSELSTLYSPSHRLEKRRTSEKSFVAEVKGAEASVAGPFRLSYLLEKDGVTASMMAYPDPSIGGGYFLLLAGLPARTLKKGEEGAMKREVTMVIDRSGSMSGEKMEQVKAAARQVIGGLEEGEAFNLIVYNEGVDLYSKRAVIKTRSSAKEAMEWISSVNTSGGTNIHDALVEALRMKPAEGMLPIVLFMTDGLPTIGETSEVAIREVAAKHNPHGRRVFTFGVGVDVNTPLLETVARESRAAATFVMPSEDVEIKVASVFRKLAGPVLADTSLEIWSESGKGIGHRVMDVIPNPLPDLFEGDQLVMLGQYKGEAPMVFEVSGNFRGKRRSFKTTFDFEKATTRNGYVARLWASRKIALLIEAIRRAGADVSLAPDRERIASDPRFKELVDEIVRISTRFGILTEYTAFLAREGTDLARRAEILRIANDNFVNRAVSVRSGIGSVNQSMNAQAQRGQAQLNPGNDYWDENMNRVSISNVQQVNDQAFYRRGNRWVDSRLVSRKRKADKTMKFGSSEFMDLARTLADEGRQGAVALEGEILLEVDGEAVLIEME